MKRKVGQPAVTGTRYKFYLGTFKNEYNKVFLRLVFGKDILKYKKWKKGTRLKIEFDKKNPFKLFISKAKKNEKSHLLQKKETTHAAWLKITWKHRKPPLFAFKKTGTTQARIKERKDCMQIELVNLVY